MYIPSAHCFHRSIEPREYLTSIYTLCYNGGKCGECTYMGHAVSEQGVHTDPSKIETVRNLPVPRNVKEIRMFFLGFKGYYRRFVKVYASIVRPLNDILIGHPTNKNVKKERNPNQNHLYVSGEKISFSDHY